MTQGCYQRKLKIYSLDGLPIDDKATQSQFGYAAHIVSPGSLKKVCCYCVKCHTLFSRVRRRITKDTLCASCAHARGDVVLFPKRSGDEKIEITCKSCGQIFLMCRQSVTPFSQCRSCQHTDSTPCSEALKPYLDDTRTVEQYGYLATTLSSKSFKQVVVICAFCGHLFKRIRRNVREQPTCVACSYKTRTTNPTKRRETFLKRYGAVGCPASSKQNYGAAEQAFCEVFETKLQRQLKKQIPLDNGYVLDLFDSVSNTGLEYNGLYWHHELSPTPRLRDYHYAKYQVCLQKNIQLITVFEDEWKERRNAVESFILNRMGVFETELGGRECAVQRVSFEEASAFLNQYHIQGAAQTQWAAWGLYAVNRLVALMSVGPHHRQGYETTAVLNRLCYAPGVHVIGGTQRLFKRLLAYVQERGWSQLITWSDNRWSLGTVYEHLGFTLQHELSPDYTYVDIAKPRRRYSKQSQRKCVTGCPSHITEHEWALRHGLARVWDCGKCKWVLSL